MKGNSESDVMLTTTCIACIGVINDSRGVSKISVAPSFFFILFLLFFQTQSRISSPRVETTFSPLQRAASTAKHKVWAELNSLSSLPCQPSKCISSEKKKKKEKKENPLASAKKNMCEPVIENAVFKPNKSEINKALVYLSIAGLLSAPREGKRLFLPHFFARTHTH